MKLFSIIDLLLQLYICSCFKTKKTANICMRRICLLIRQSSHIHAKKLIKDSVQSSCLLAIFMLIRTKHETLI